MARSEDEMFSTVQSQMQERQCAKQELFGRGVSEECLSTRRLAAILNKGIVTIDYNEVYYNIINFIRNFAQNNENTDARLRAQHDQ
jgi:hypothetical protein